MGYAGCGCSFAAMRRNFGLPHISGNFVWRSTDDQSTVLSMLTVNPARALRLPNYGLERGKDADMVVLDTECVADAIIDLPERSWVIKRGRVVARSEKRVEYAF